MFLDGWRVCLCLSLSKLKLFQKRNHRDNSEPYKENSPALPNVYAFSRVFEKFSYLTSIAYFLKYPGKQKLILVQRFLLANIWQYAPIRSFNLPGYSRH